MTFKFFDKLSQNFIELINDKDDYNVVIKVKNEKLFTAHSNILKCRSPYFRKELENTTPGKNNVKTISKRNVSDQIFEIILKYIYGGIVKFENADTLFIFDLMMAASEFELGELTEKLEALLIDTKISWLKSNFFQVYHSIFSKSNFKALEKFCNEIVVRNPSLIFDADGFSSLQESALVSLLRQDSLQLEEVKIWEYTIKWGIAQNTSLPANLEEWTDENFTALKTSLQQCLPYIRYFQIPGADIWNKLKPYKKILDKQLWNDLIQYLVVPDQPLESKILPPRKVLSQELPSNRNVPVSTENTPEGLNNPLPALSAPALSALPSARAIYDYEASENNEISLEKGQIVTDIDFVSEDWWDGTGKGGIKGLFPANFVELLNKK
ncbi:hypothetical protein Glove_294g151 [Diversispora epigaea]|uniref:BTB domain-containing protein n=1 Tax=Diversispora epigaea TaxID=1348612 RepID=A0A397I302_9GLOM|nr:hypothetical protein Glove_294g151 [Diversispora epigaea]